MSNEITTVHNENNYSLADISEMARVITVGGLFGYKKAEEAMTLMLMAQADGIHPAKAAQEYHIINGKPALKSQAMQSRFQAAGGSTKWIKRTDKECTLHLSHPQGGELDVTWTIEMAQNAGLTRNDTWKKYPTSMLSARCISEGVRALYPACLNGMYSEEEVKDFTSDEKPAEAPANATRNERKESKKVSAAEEAELIKESIAPIEAEIVTSEMDDKTKTFVSWMEGLKAHNGKNFDKAWEKYSSRYGDDFTSVGESERGAVYTDVKRTIANIVAAEMMNNNEEA